MKNKIGIIGAGYVGTACEIGFSQLNNTEVKVYDKFKDSEAHDTVVAHSDILFICVPTPMRKDGGCDTSIVVEACERINKVARKERVIVIKSTVPPGTTDFLQTEFDRHHFFFNPEFLTEANFVNDFIEQKLLVIGESIRGPNKKLTAFYDTFTANQKVPAIKRVCNAATAEMLKYTINCFLATKVVFFNEIFRICERTQADFSVLTDIIGHDERIGKSHMRVPGPDGQFGMGGSCFSKDMNALIAFARAHGADASLLEACWDKNLRIRDVHEWETLAQVTGKYKRTAT